MKKGALLKVIVCVLAITGAVVGRASTKFATGWYTPTSNPSACNLETLPSGCVTSPMSGVYCTVSSGEGTKKFFANSSCTAPYYRVQ